MTFTFLEQTTSTNDEALDSRYGHGDVIVTEYQTAGRGQRGHAWKSARGENLILSIVLCPTFLAASEQFLLLQTVAVALTDLMKLFGLDARIKWTNDIYVDDRKLVGVLIENSLGEGCVVRSRVGIGINVNQKTFDPSLPNPTSMALEIGKELDRRKLLTHFYDLFMARYADLEAGRREKLASDYRQLIYRLNERSRFQLPDGTLCEGVIRDVEPNGALIVEHPSGEKRSYLFREITLLIPS